MGHNAENRQDICRVPEAPKARAKQIGPLLRINPVILVRCRSAVKHSNRPTGSATTSCLPSSLFSCVENEIRFDPVTIGLRNLSNWVNEWSLRRPLPPCERSPVPEPCFYPGTKRQ